MPLFNLAWKTAFFWDGRAPSLRGQVLIPIEEHTAMDEKLDRVTAKLAAAAPYPALFRAAFGSPEITAEQLALALENFLLTRTAPYLHDGRFPTLEEVVAHYSTGIHPSPTLDPNLVKHPTAGLQLSAADQRAFVAFLKTLTDFPEPP